MLGSSRQSVLVHLQFQQPCLYSFWCMVSDQTQEFKTAAHWAYEKCSPWKDFHLATFWWNMVQPRNKAPRVWSPFPKGTWAERLSKESPLDYFNMRNSWFSPRLIVRNLDSRLKSSMRIVSLNHDSLADISNGKQECIMVSAALGVGGAAQPVFNPTASLPLWLGSTPVSLQTVEILSLP